MKDFTEVDFPKVVIGRTVSSVDPTVHFAKYIPRPEYRKPDRIYRPMAFGFSIYKIFFVGNSQTEDRVDELWVKSFGTTDIDSNLLDLLPVRLEVPGGGECTAFGEYKILRNLSGETIVDVVLAKDMLGVITRAVFKFTEGDDAEFNGQQRLYFNLQKIGR